MAGKDRLISNLNKLIREDPYVLELCTSMGIELDVIEELLEKIYDNYWFDTMDEDIGIPFMEDLLEMDLSNMTTDEKRSAIQAKWRNNSKCSEESLQNICDSWNNGVIEVDFEADELNINFVGVGGVPSDLESLEEEINKAKPAYLLANYIFSYLYWDLFESFSLTWDGFETINKTFDEWEVTIFDPST